MFQRFGSLKFWTTGEVHLEMPEAHGNFVSEGGLSLFYRFWEATHAKGVCLVAHGIGEHSGRYTELAEQLNTAGFSVWALDFRGHGRSNGQRGDCRSLGELVEDLHRLIKTSLVNLPDLPRILIGHSLGGLVALACAQKHSDLLNGVAVSSPALKLAQEPPGIKGVLSEALSKLLPTTHIPNGVIPSHLCRDPQVVRRYTTDPLVHRMITARAVVSLRKAMRNSHSLAKTLKIPVLILQAGSDKVCDAKTSEQFSQMLAPDQVTFKRYDGLYHELFNEPERDQVIADLVRWLEKVSTS